MVWKSNLEIVRVGDQYGIRRRRGLWPFRSYEFVSLSNGSPYWYGTNENITAFCLGSKEVVMMKWQSLQKEKAILNAEPLTQLETEFFNKK